MVRSSVYVNPVLMAAMESTADPLGGGGEADLFAGTPFKATGWAG